MPRLDVVLRVEIGGDLFPTPVLLGAVVAAGEHECTGDKDENSWVAHIPGQWQQWRPRKREMRRLFSQPGAERKSLQKRK